MPVRKVTVEDFVPYNEIVAEHPLQVDFITTESPINAVVQEEGETFAVKLTRLSKTDIELECLCPQEEGVCSHGANVFYAFLKQKAAKQPAPQPAAPPKRQPTPVVPNAPSTAKDFSFKPAVRAASYLKLGLYGASGSGKTYSALRIAQGIVAREGGEIFVIDTEYGSASKYADRFVFNQLSLPHDAPPEDTIFAMAAAEDAGAKVLIIDSASHEWESIKDYVSTISKAPQFRNNTWAAWSEGTPKQQAFVMAILSFPGHVICTMRAKTEWLAEQVNGKTRPQRVGLTPQQGKGIEYEFDMLMLISPEHVAVVEKDRTGKFQDAVIEKPSEEFGGKLSEWLRPNDEGGTNDADQ